MALIDRNFSQIHSYNVGTSVRQADFLRLNFCPDRVFIRSANRGLSWTLVNKLIVLSETFQPRGYASLLVDKDNYMLLFGGKEKHDRAVLDELWRGRINRLGFKE